MEAQGTYGPYLRNHNQLYGDRQRSHFTPNIPGHGNSINFGGNNLLLLLIIIIILFIRLFVTLLLIMIIRLLISCEIYSCNSFQALI